MTTMKNFKLLFGLLISAIILSCSSDDSGEIGEQLNPKLPKKIISTYNTPNSPVYSYEFSYNSNNTIREIIHKEDGESDWVWKFYYENDIPVKSELIYGAIINVVYEYENEQLMYERYSNSNFPDDYVNFRYFYTNGKLDYAGFVNTGVFFYYDFDSNGNKTKQEDSNGVTLYTYDNKKNPFINLSSKMNPIFICNQIAEELGVHARGELTLFLNSNPNNITIINRNNYFITFEYEYDNEDYPIKLTRAIEASSGNNYNQIYTFEYYN